MFPNIVVDTTHDLFLAFDDDVRSTKGTNYSGKDEANFEKKFGTFFFLFEALLVFVFEGCLIFFNRKKTEIC